MKARHTPLETAVIFGGLDEAAERTLKQDAVKCGYKAIKADEDAGGATVKSILAGKPDGKDKLKNERFLIINGGGANSARLIDMLRGDGLVIDLKALVTLHNQEWKLNSLIDELISEHNSFLEREGKGI